MTEVASPTVSVVLATLNERPALPELFERLERLGLPEWEIVVVDDGSIDGTRELVTERAARDSRYRLVLHDGKQTTVRAQGRGIVAARGRWIVVMDSDLQHPPEMVPEMLRSLDAGVGVVVASRYLPEGSVGPRSPFRAALSRGAEYIAKILLRDARRVSDPVSGFFAFRREIYEPLPPGYRGYKLLLFVLVMARGRPVAEVPLRFEPRTDGASKVVSGLGFVRVYLQELLLARRLQYRRAHPSRTAVTVPEPESW